MAWKTSLAPAPAEQHLPAAAVTSQLQHNPNVLLLFFLHESLPCFSIILSANCFCNLSYVKINIGDYFYNKIPEDALFCGQVLAKTNIKHHLILPQSITPL